MQFPVACADVETLHFLVNITYDTTTLERVAIVNFRCRIHYVASTYIIYT
jgi:hypothetical protein